jgi:hypothetical protein
VANPSCRVNLSLRIALRERTIRDNRFRRIINAPSLALLRVVLSKERLVEMKNRIASFSLFEILVKDVPDICDGEDLCNVINGRLELLRRVK